MALLTSFLALRQDPRLLRIPPYLSLLCVVLGIAWLFVLPLNQYSRGTYISENALLPGQVHTYFGGSEHNVFRAYRHEVAALAQSSAHEVVQALGDIFKSQELKVGTQRYEYNTAGRKALGENVYAILQGPRADATEAVVLAAAWRNTDDVLNQSGVALVLTMARYLKRWSLWSKDIIFLITSDSTAGPQAWVDAYHSTPLCNTNISDLPIKAGALQGAVVLDYPAGPGGHRFDKLHVIYDGVNGQLPNLDLFNTVVNIANGQHGMGCTLQRMWNHKDTYRDRLEAILRGLLHQSLGHASGPHSAFIPYHVDAITLQAVGDGWHDEMSLGRVVESTFRSLNNLLEHLHQSFFFYLLMQSNRFVSIGTYLPSAMLIAVNFSIISIALWVQSGRPNKPIAQPFGTKSPKAIKEASELRSFEYQGMTALVPKGLLATSERELSLPLAVICIVHFLGLAPLYVFNNISEASMAAAVLITFLICAILPHLCAFMLTYHLHATPQHLTLITSFSLLLLGISISTLSTLNFSLGLMIGLVTFPLSSTHLIWSRQDPASSLRARTLTTMVVSVLLNLLSPPGILYISACTMNGMDVARVNETVTQILTVASFAWKVSGTWTAIVVWLVWWPAWFVGAMVLACGNFTSVRDGSTQGERSK